MRILYYGRKSDYVKAEIIAVGTELLLGQVVNTNATFLSEELAALGFEVYYQTVVGDNPARLEELLQLAETRSQLIVLCGGLGPTDDDLTRDVVAKHVNEALITDEEAMAKIENHINRAGHPMTENNRRQALSIKHGRVIQNPNGLAAGTLYQNGQVTFLLLPGPPGELIPMFRQNARPLLAELLPQQDLLSSRVMRFFGIGESRLVTVLADLIDGQTNPTIAPYAQPNEVTLRLTAKAANEEEAQSMLDELEGSVMALVGDYFYGYGDGNSLVAETVKELKRVGLTVTSAESLTAGLFQSTLGSVPGVSDVYKGGFVTYSNQAKEDLLGIPNGLIAEHGVVSREVAMAMAEEARLAMDSDYSISFTGVAGPDELEGQPAGTVWIGVASKDSGVYAKLFQFNRDRNYIRHSAVMAGLDLLRKQILGEKLQ